MLSFWAILSFLEVLKISVVAEADHSNFERADPEGRVFLLKFEFAAWFPLKRKEKGFLFLLVWSA